MSSDNTSEINTPQPIYLADYTPPDFLVDTIDLTFELDPAVTRVESRLAVRRSATAASQAPLRLDGQEQRLLEVALNGERLSADRYRLDSDQLVIEELPDRFELKVVSEIAPEKNTALEGLYTSSGNFCTQCEAEGFRKITYYPDRPDVMAVFTTTIIADKARYPVLLSNGNPTARAELDGGRHSVTWHDPFPKPCYLFALVAGDLACVEDHFTTASGREVLLQIFVQHGNEEKTAHAMASLKQAMAWDERSYGREYDLDIYMIVAVDDFNMGAMENKGLNIFNSRYVLAEAETATDQDFLGIEGVIAHEYFHNWSGNRVTCRDWFQLSLKEGFTVFRDQQFSAEMNSAAIKRIDDVTMLRAHQFAEDGGPMAHPVRPASYVEINNFYTLTVYEKGAELIGMLHTILGPEGFRRGSDLYFERHDGEAATCDQFIAAMADANGVDLQPFMPWYSQAGTPTLKVERHYDAQQQRLTLTFSQQLPPTPESEEKVAQWIPIRIALFDPRGHHLPLGETEEGEAPIEERVLNLTAFTQSFSFEGVPEGSVPSLLRGFSAPVKLESDYSDGELAFLLAHDDDPFNRWDAGQQLMVRLLLADYHSGAEPGAAPLPETLLRAFERTLHSHELDKALVAEALSLPAESYLAEFIDELDPQRLHQCRRRMQYALADTFRVGLLECYQGNTRAGKYHIDAEAMGKRRLRNLALHYLMSLEDEAVTVLCRQQYRVADNMTDSLAALTELHHHGADPADESLDHFYRRWRDDPLVIDKWFALQATAPGEESFERIEALAGHEAFTLANPNRVRALYGAFGMRNPSAFHRSDGRGYRFYADAILALDRRNPQIAARLATPLTRWRRYQPLRGRVMRGELERLLAAEGLSRDLYEVVSKSLA